MNHAIFCFKVVKLCAQTEPSESKVRLEGTLKQLQGNDIGAWDNYVLNQQIVG